MSIKIDSKQKEVVKIKHSVIKDYISNLKNVAEGFPHLEKFTETDLNTFHIKTKNKNINGEDYFLEFEAKYNLSSDGNAILIESVSSEHNLNIEKGLINIKEHCPESTEVEIHFIGSLNLGMGKMKEMLVQPIIKNFINNKLKEYLKEIQVI